MANPNGGSFWNAMYRSLRLSRTLAIVIALTVSVAANAMLFVGGVLYNVVDTFVEDVTGLQTASGKQRKDVRRLQKENRLLRRKIEKVRGVARSAAKRTRTRAVKSAIRSLATLPGKALPFAGAVISAAITAQEIKDLCDTIGDMNDLKREIDPFEAVDDGETKVCSTPVPDAKEIMAQIARSPQAAWEKSKKFVPDLNSLPDVRSLLNKSWKDMKSLIGLPECVYFWRSDDNDCGY